MNDSDYTRYEEDPAPDGVTPPVIPEYPPPKSRLTLISYLVLVLLVVVWPVSSVYFLEDQLDLASETLDPLSEIYLPTMLVQSLILIGVFFALRSERATPADIGLKGYSFWSVFQAIAFFMIANFVLGILQTAIATGSPTSFAEFSSMLPKTLLEKSVWAILCALVAVSEEVTFRGYIMTRITMLAGGRIWVGVLVSALAFASGHVYQGPGGLVLIFVYGLMFCGLCLYTGSLYPAIIAHFIQDIVVIFFPGAAG